MMISRMAWAAVGCSLLAACGGGTDTTTGTSFPFAAPVAGTSKIFSTVTVDDSNNSINGTIEDTVQSVSSDGSFVVNEDDPTNNSLTVNGVVYKTVPQSINFGSDGFETNYVVNPSGSAVACSIAVTSGGRPLPLQLGEAWSRNYTITCQSEAAVAYAQNATVMSSESVTVPAGTFTALKVQGTVSWTTPTGQSITQTYTRWIDPASAFSTLKEISTFTRSGAVPAHYPVTETTVLQSRT